MIRRGPLAWMVDHGVAPNLMMVLFIVGGLMASLAIKKEVFPNLKRKSSKLASATPVPHRKMLSKVCYYRLKLPLLTWRASMN